MKPATYTVEATFRTDISFARNMRWHADKATRQQTEAFAESLMGRNWVAPLQSVRAIDDETGAEVYYREN
jgi:hypothetical protein